MRGDTRQSAQGDTFFVFQLRTTLKEDHFAVQEAGPSGVPNVRKQRVASGFNVVRNGLLRQWDVLGARGSAAGFRIV